MRTKVPLEPLKEEERKAWIRLAAFRARLYRRDSASPIDVERRLRELERKWKGAADRLSKAQRESRA